MATLVGDSAVMTAQGRDPVCSEPWGSGRGALQNSMTDDEGTKVGWPCSLKGEVSWWQSGECSCSASGMGGLHTATEVPLKPKCGQEHRVIRHQLSKNM